jgi:hypothetical protein
MAAVFKLLHQHGVGDKDILPLMASLEFTHGKTLIALVLSKTSSQIYSLLLGVKVDYGLGLSYRPASL